MTTTNTKTPIINREQLINAVKMALLAKENIMIVGPPGCGKTEITEQVTRAITPHVYVGTPAVEDPTPRGTQAPPGHGTARKG